MSRVGRLLAVAGVIVSACISVGSVRLQACSCIESGPPCQEAWRAEGVFVGQVLRITQEAETRNLDGRVFDVPVFRVRTRVAERFRGDLKSEVDVFTSTTDSGCGYAFTDGRSYLIYAHWELLKNRWSTGICSRTRPASEAGEDLDYLRGPATQPASLGVISGTATRMDPDPASEHREYWRKPYPSARIIAEAVSATYEARTGPDGRYSMRVPPGKYSVRPILPSTLYIWAPVTAEVRDVRGCAEVKFSVRSDGRISGRVVDEDGQPVPYLTLGALDATTATRPAFTATASARTDAAGNFEFTRLAPNVYRLGLDLRKEMRADTENARWFSGGDGQPYEVSLALEQQTWTREFVLPRSVSIIPVSGVVLDAGGKPVPKARVYMMAAGNSIAGETVTDDAGSFRFSVRAGFDYRLSAERLVSGKWVRSQASFKAVSGLAPFKLRFEQ